MGLRNLRLVVARRRLSEVERTQRGHAAGDAMEGKAVLRPATSESQGYRVVGAGNEIGGEN